MYSWCISDVSGKGSQEGVFCLAICQNLYHFVVGTFYEHFAYVPVGIENGLPMISVPSKLKERGHGI